MSSRSWRLYGKINHIRTQGQEYPGQALQQAIKALSNAAEKARRWPWVMRKKNSAGNRN